MADTKQQFEHVIAICRDLFAKKLPLKHFLIDTDSGHRSKEISQALKVRI